MGDSSYKGVSASQDSRFTDKEASLLRKLKFPRHFDTKVDMHKVELSVMKPWIARRITELLGFEDEVVLEYAVGMLEEGRYPDAKKMQIQLTGFLEASTQEFMAELWELLVSAQASPGGVPQRFVEEKKQELRSKREEGERVVREARERAQRAAQAAGSNNDAQSAKRRSRWDAGAPSESSRGQWDSRPPAYALRGVASRTEDRMLDAASVTAAETRRSAVAIRAGARAERMPHDPPIHGVLREGVPRHHEDDRLHQRREMSVDDHHRGPDRARAP